MRRLADQHRTTVAQLEHESLQLKHQLLRGLCVSVCSREVHGDRDGSITAVLPQ